MKDQSIIASFRWISGWQAQYDENVVPAHALTNQVYGSLTSTGVTYDVGIISYTHQASQELTLFLTTSVWNEESHFLRSHPPSSYVHFVVMVIS